MSYEDKLVRWSLWSKSTMSSLEIWFFEEVILKHDLLRKFDVYYEYSVKSDFIKESYFVDSYFIDFAFPDLMIAVELDGPYHKINNKRQYHDKKRDSILRDMGWVIYRISYMDLREEKKKNEIVDNFVSDILQYQNHCLYKKHGFLLRNIHRNTNDRYSKLTNKQKRIVLYEEQQHQRIKKILDSNIDFQKRTWISKTSKIIGIHHTRIIHWMRKWMPQTLSKAYRH